MQGSLVAVKQVPASVEGFELQLTGPEAMAVIVRAEKLSLKHRTLVSDPRPCNIYESSGTPCVAAHSTVRALYSSYQGKLYQLVRQPGNHSTDIGVLEAGGIVNAAAHDAFCRNSTPGSCTIVRIYDQSPKRNHLDNFAAKDDSGVNASDAPITIRGHKAYGLYFDAPNRHPSWAPIHKGYRNDRATGLAVGDEPESMYMVASGTHFNDQCCFD